VDPGEIAEEALEREVLEETGLKVAVGGLVAVNSQLPQLLSSPHTSIHLLYHCTPTRGTLVATAEASEVAYRDPRTIDRWHGDHRHWALQAMQGPIPARSHTPRPS
jgi:8-oxo-dGTP pyrophosphatase MutT (NUDIX family)